MKADLQVIGTGFGRTGTDAMREALEVLGFGPCHHMRSLTQDDAHKQHWSDCMTRGVMDWDLLLGSYRSCVDWPSAHYWRQLIERFPDAKVLLTWRSAESWWRSLEQTILKAVREHIANGNLTPGNRVLLELFDGKPMDREHSLALYRANVAAVKACVAPDRLLAYELGSGWQPLWDFLGVAVPAQPFPRSNSTAEFQKIFASPT